MPNPYLPPKSDAGQTKRRGKFRPLIRAVAWVAALASVPFFWLGMELANQKYFHLWDRNFELTGVESGGVAISTTTIVSFLAISSIILWAVSLACFRLFRK